MKLKIDLDFNRSKKYYLTCIGAVLNEPVGYTLMWTTATIKAMTKCPFKIIEEGTVEVHFNTMEDYIDCLEKSMERGNWFLICADQYEYFKAEVLKEIDWPFDNPEEVVCVFPNSNMRGYYNDRYYCGLKQYKASTFYEDYVHYSDTEITAEDAKRIAEELVENGGDKYAYARHLNKALTRLKDFQNVYVCDEDSVIRLCQNVQKYLNSKGCVMSALEIQYLDGTTKLGYAATARDIICLIDRSKINKVISINTIGVSLVSLKAGETYKVTVEGRGVFQYTHDTMERFSKLFNRYFKRRINFVIEGW